MPRSIWTQRIIAILNALAFGFVVDRVTSSPLIGLGSAVVGMVVLLVFLRRKPLVETLFNVDHEGALVLRTVGLSLTFFALCATAAYLILA